MNHQYWLTKNAKKLQRKFNAKEDENIVNSDNELDLKIELFKSVQDSSNNLCKIVENYKDQLLLLCQEQTDLGRFLRDCGKNSSSSSAIMVNSGKVICYLGQQHMTLQTSLFRTLQEINTFKRAINDTKQTMKLMETERTEYRAALTLMKTCSSDIDPDSGKGIEKFRTAQQYVKFSKGKFDKFSLACLQKIDLLAAARCNLFSYSLATYQTNWMTLCQKNEEVLATNIKMIEKEPLRHNFGVLKDLAQEIESKTNEEDGETIDLEKKDNEDQRLFFGDEFSDRTESGKEEKVDNKETTKAQNNDDKLIDYEKDFDEFMSSSNIFMPSQLLLDDSLFASSDIDNDSNMDLLGALSTQTNHPFSQTSTRDEGNAKLNKNPSKSKSSDVSKWFQLFSELDPLNQQNEVKDASENLHAA
ncbi:unnamed protein product [Diamesa serratosioi]